MYNGIGLSTARGSGTNGYVQRNLAYVWDKKKEDYKAHDFKCEAVFRKPNKDILEHEKKRKIELKCVELEDLMERQGFSHENIEAKVNVYRQSLIDNYKDQTKNDCKFNAEELEKDIGDRTVGNSSHEKAVAKILQDQRFQHALNIKPNTTKISLHNKDISDNAKLSKSKRKHDDKKKEKKFYNNQSEQKRSKKSAKEK